MKKLLLLVVILLAFTSRAAAAGGINLAWNECVGASGTYDRHFACDTNAGANVLVGSFVLDLGIAEFVSVEVTASMFFEASTLPSWWDFPNDNGPSYCRNALAVTFDFSALPGGCIDPFGQPAAGGLAFYHEGSSPGGSMAPNRAWLKAGGAVATPTLLEAGVEYYGVRIAIANLKTVGDGACSGCSVPGCIQLDEIKAVGNDHSEWNTTPVISNIAVWQGGGSYNCVVATRNVTWGQVKALYR